MNISNDSWNKFITLFAFVWSHFIWSCHFKNLVQYFNKSILHEYFIEVLVWIYIEQCINSLCSPLLKLNLWNLCNELLQDCSYTSILVLWDSLNFLRIIEHWEYFQECNPALLPNSSNSNNSTIIFITLSLILKKR